MLSDGQDKRRRRRSHTAKPLRWPIENFRVNPDNATATGHLALYYARMGDVKEGLVLIHRARALDHSNVRLIYNEAAIQALAGNFHQALDCLREAFEKGYPPSGAKVDPELNGVRGQTEFQHLVAAFSKQRSR